MFSKNKIVFFLILFICFSIGQVVYASDVSANEIQVSANNLQASAIGSGILEVIRKIGKWIVDNIIFILGTFTIEAMLVIILEVRKRNSDIASVEIELLSQKPNNKEGYTFFECDKIFFGNNMIEKSKLWSSFYYSIIIKMDNPEEKKKIHTLAIKKLILVVDKYVFVYYPAEGDKHKYRKCSVSLDNDECHLLLESPKTKSLDSEEKFNAVRFFNEPNQVKMYIEFINNPNILTIFSFLFLKTRKVFFEKKNHCQGSGRIVIDNKDILKGKYENG